MILKQFDQLAGILRQKFPFVIIILRGFGQIMLQENAATGLLFLIGIFYGSMPMGLAAILAVCTGTITAKIFGYDNFEIEKGLYGFSAALVGVAIVLFFEPVFLIWLFIILGSILAAVTQHFFIKKQIPVFTLPFVFVTWIILFVVQQFYPVIISASIPIAQDFTFAFRGFGQVIFQASVFSGIIFFLAVYINSPISALYGLAGAVLAATLAFSLSAPVADIGIGLSSFNAVLCAIVFAGNKTKDGIWVLISVVLSVIISLMMFKYHLVQLTFPFVAATCISLVLRNIAAKIFERQKPALTTKKL